MNIKLDEITNKEVVLLISDQSKVTELAESFGPNGLGMFHPITVIKQYAHAYKILAGKKRLAAFIKLGLDSIPAHIIDLGSKSERQISLEENLRRYNVPWYEQAELEAEFHALRVSEHGANKGGKPPKTGKVGWSQNDTARELGIAMGGLSQSIAISNAIKSNPSLMLVKDKETALKLIRRTVKAEDAENEALIPSEFEMNRVFLGDSISILPQIPSNTFDACITDPPWTDYDRDASLTRDASTLPVFKEIFRLLKPDGFLYAVVNTPDFYLYQKELPGFGFRIQNHPLIWEKPGTITHGRRPWEYARDYEPIILAVKGNPVLTVSTELQSIFRFNALHTSKLIHPHEKPFGLIEKILQQCTYQGSKVLDPFAGSGVVLDTCRKMKRSFIGVERDKNFYTNILKRLEK